MYNTKSLQKKQTKEALMLKKLVKYGNSNALVLDKAILELLNIKEGSILKISTDGKSLILTPHEKSMSEEIQETYTNEQAFADVFVQQHFKQHNLSEESMKELSDLHKQFREIVFGLRENTKYSEELKKLDKTFPDASSLEALEAHKKLRYKFAPKLKTIEERFFSLQNTYAPKGKKSFTKELQKEMEQDFAKAFKGFKKEDRAACSIFLDNPEYQHELQLLVEKYKNTKDSTQYLKDFEELLRKYSPETQKLRDELKAISEKYSQS